MNRAGSILLASPIALVLGLALAACADNQTTLPQGQTYDAGTPAPLACVPNLDGKIDSNELAPAFDVPAHYLVNPTGVSRTIDVTGKVDSSGVRVWDYSTPFTDDRIATITAQKPDAQWFAGSFPGAEFVAPVDLGARTVGIYARSESEIRLLGIASTDPNPPEGKTLIVYDPPVSLYRLPLTVGSSHSSTGVSRNATFRGQPYAGRDTYEVSVDASGKLILPDITFTQALRVRTLVTVEPIAGQKTTQRQVSWFYECFGEVARATSTANEPNEDFSNVAELRRLGLGPP